MKKDLKLDLENLLLMFGTYEPHYSVQDVGYTLYAFFLDNIESLTEENIRNIVSSYESQYVPLKENINED